MMSLAKGVWNGIFATEEEPESSREEEIVKDKKTKTVPLSIITTPSLNEEEEDTRKRKGQDLEEPQAESTLASSMTPQKSSLKKSRSLRGNLYILSLHE